MGQRLVVNVKNKDKILANAYYHWSGFSEESLITIRPIIEHMMANEVKVEDIEGAIKLLRLTGAEVVPEEFDEIKEEVPNLVKGEEVNRNDGLISVTKEGIEESIYWAEGLININLDSKTFDYGVVFSTTKEEHKRDYDEELTEDMLMKSNFPLEDISFSKFEEFYEEITTLVSKEKYLVVGETIYCPIY